MVIGAEKYDFHARGTSVEMAIQEVAREAIVRLRYEHRELWEALHQPSSAGTQGSGRPRRLDPTWAFHHEEMHGGNHLRL